MVNSRRKGKRGELEARDQVRTYWKSPACIRAAQACGKHSADLLNALHGAHVEVKSVARLGALRYMEQAERDAEPAGELPIVLARETGRREFLVMFSIGDTWGFARRILGALMKYDPHGAEMLLDGARAVSAQLPGAEGAGD